MVDTEAVQEVEVLNKERENVRQEIERLRLALSSEVDPTEEEGDPEIVEREKTLAVIYALERKLDDIEFALRAAKEGTYGICEVCGKPIDPARLRIIPGATRCVPCKAATERRSRR